MASFPTLLNCVFAAYLYGGPALAEHSYEPVPASANECQFSAWIRQGELHLKVSEQEVFITLPILEGWYRFQYQWGKDKAYMMAPGDTTWYQIPIRLGSAEFY